MIPINKANEIFKKINNENYNSKWNIIKIFLNNCIKPINEKLEIILIDNKNIEYNQSYDHINKCINVNINKYFIHSSDNNVVKKELINLIDDLNHELRHYHQLKHNEHITKFKDKKFYDSKMNRNVNDMIKNIIYYCNKYEIDAFSYQCSLKIKRGFKIKNTKEYKLYFEILNEYLSSINIIEINKYNKIKHLVSLSQKLFLKKVYKFSGYKNAIK